MLVVGKKKLVVYGESSLGMLRLLWWRVLVVFCVSVLAFGWGVSVFKVKCRFVCSAELFRFYRKTKSVFSFGLVVFGFAFLLKDIVASPFITGIFSFVASGLGPFIVLPDIFEFAALSVLLYMYLKY